jgi:hypothetical protein
MHRKIITLRSLWILMLKLIPMDFLLKIVVIVSSPFWHVVVSFSILLRVFYLPPYFFGYPPQKYIVKSPRIHIINNFSCCWLLLLFLWGNKYRSYFSFLVFVKISLYPKIWSILKKVPCCWKTCIVYRFG